jgi:hypothetical protein
MKKNHSISHLKLKTNLNKKLAQTLGLIIIIEKSID